MLRAFYDGSGKGEDRNSKSPFLTLAGIAAYDNVWSDFERAWRDLLAKHHMCFLHMQDFAGVVGCFDGKTRLEAERAVDDFVALISSLDTAQYHAYGCTINLDDFKRAALVSEHVKRRTPAIFA